MSVYLVFLLSFIMITVFVWFIFPQKLSVLFSKITSIGIHAFPTTNNDLPKFALIRILFGLTLSIRGFELLNHLVFDDFSNFPVIFFAILGFLTGIFLVFGFLTQYIFIYLVFIQWLIGDAILGTATLGNLVAAILSWFLLLTNSGRFISIDGALLRRFHTKKLSTFLLYYPNITTEKTILASKMAALFSYWLMCVYSICMHICESAWTTGVAGPLLLSNNFMSRYHYEFASLFLNNGTAILFSKISLWLMMAWYITVLPFVLIGGVWRRYVIVWGLLFFALSEFILQLGWLAEIEFLLWAVLFLNYPKINDCQSFEVAFDDKCNLCDKTIQIVKYLDVFDCIKLLPISVNKEWLANKNIPKNVALTDLYGLDLKSNCLFSGYAFYLKLSQKLVFLWPLHPLLLIGKWTTIGPRIYRYIASYRINLFGVCNFPRRKKESILSSSQNKTNNPIHVIYQERIISIIFFQILVLGFFYLIAIPIPKYGYSGWQTMLATTARIYGVSPIDVFNKTDLKMAENWFTISFKKNETELLLPILANDGSRLSYHHSDRVYFGNTLLYRRAHIDQDGCFFNSEVQRLNYLSKIYLQKNHYQSGRYQFIYRQYFQPLPDSNLLAINKFVPNTISRRCEIVFNLKLSNQQLALM